MLPQGRSAVHLTYARAETLRYFEQIRELRQYRPAHEYYRRNNVEAVVCAEKHMGSRAIVVVCRDEAIAKVRFGVEGKGSGIICTRTGRRFFNDSELERAVLDRLISSLTGAGFWEKFQCAWFCLDCELMPWSVKAEDLLRTQSTGAAANAAVDSARTALIRLYATDPASRDSYAARARRPAPHQG
jgi:protein phosphatase